MKVRQETCEYQDDILQHLIELQKASMPKLALIQQQPEINLKMRPLLLDFLMDVTAKLSLSSSTFPMTVNFIDRYCSTRIVKKQHYQLLGLTALWISCKNVDSKFKIPTLFDLCKMCCNCYDKKLFLEMENHLLKSLGWNISFPSFDSFIDIFMNKLASKGILGGVSKDEIKHLSFYICELVQFYPNVYFNYTSSQIALGALITSMLVYKVPISINSTLSFLGTEIDDDSMLSLSNFQNFHQNLLKILKCPPPSLKLKYFSGTGSYITTMKRMIDYVHENLMETPITPKLHASPYRKEILPRTPCSSNISPKVISDGAGSLSRNKQICNLAASSKGLLPSPKSSPNFVPTEFFSAFGEDACISTSSALNDYTTIRFSSHKSENINRKRSHEDISVTSPAKKQRTAEVALSVNAEVRPNRSS